MQETINDKKNNNDESIISHIEALRSMLINSLMAILILFPAGFFCAPKFIDFLVKNSLPEKIAKLHYFSPMEVFVVQLKTGFVIALVFAFPFVAAEIKKFIVPALYEHEKKFLSMLVVASTLLFILGNLVCIFFILPLVMNFSAGFSTNQIEATLGFSNFINISAGLMLAFGLMFQFPLLIILAVKFNLIEVDDLRDKRPYIVIIILIFSAILTPPDIISQLMLGIPTWLLFEIGLFVSEKIGKASQL